MSTGIYPRTKDAIRKRVETFKENGKTKGSLHWNWKGDEVEYSALHRWLRDNFGKAQKCEFQDESCGGPFHWANKSGNYRRDLSDWLHLCQSHHLRYDGYVGKLTVDDVKEIRQVYSREKTSHAKLAVQFNVSRMTIYNIIHRKKWGHVR